MVTITVDELCQALHCTDRNIRKREGSTMPEPVDNYPRRYDLASVLWVVGGVERERICLHVGVSVDCMQNAMAECVGAEPEVDLDDEAVDYLLM